MKRTRWIVLTTAAALAVGGVALAETLQYRAHPVGEFEVPARVTDGGPPSCERTLGGSRHRRRRRGIAERARSWTVRASRRMMCR